MRQILKTLRKIIFTVSVVIVSLFFLAIIIPVFFGQSDPPLPDVNPPLPNPLIGTWRHINHESDIYVIREDGTGLSGSSWIRNEIAWGIFDGEFREMSSNGHPSSSRTFSFDDDILTIFVRPTRGTPYIRTFQFYSEATDLYEENLQIFNFVVLPVLALAGIFLLWRNIKKRGYKLKEFFADAAAFSFPLFLIFFRILNFQIVLPLVLSLILLFVVRSLYSKYLLRQVPGSEFFDLPLSSHKGSVTEKHLHTPLSSRFRREWIVFDTTDGEQLKAYIPLVGTGSERELLDAFQIGDAGILHYRRGKKFDSFEEFVHERIEREDM